MSTRLVSLFILLVAVAVANVPPGGNPPPGGAHPPPPPSANATFSGNATVIALLKDTNATNATNAVVADVQGYVTSPDAESIIVSAAVVDCCIGNENQILFNVTVNPNATARETVDAFVAEVKNMASANFPQLVAIYNSLWADQFTSAEYPTAASANDELTLVSFDFMGPPQNGSEPQHPRPLRVEIHVVGDAVAMETLLNRTVDVDTATGLIDTDLDGVAALTNDYNKSMLLVEPMMMMPGPQDDMKGSWNITFTLNVTNTSTPPEHNATSLEVLLRETMLGAQNATLDGTWMTQTALSYWAALQAINLTTPLLDVTNVFVNRPAEPLPPPTMEPSLEPTTPPTTDSPVLSFIMTITGAHDLLKNVASLLFGSNVEMDLRAAPVLANAAVDVVSAVLGNVTMSTDNGTIGYYFVQFTARHAANETAMEFLSAVQGSLLGVQSENNTWLLNTFAVYDPAANATILLNVTTIEMVNVTDAPDVTTPTTLEPTTIQPPPTPTLPLIANVSLLFEVDNETTITAIMPHKVALATALSADLMDLTNATVVNTTVDVAAENDKAFVAAFDLISNENVTIQDALGSIYSVQGTAITTWATHTEVLLATLDSITFTVLKEIVSNPAFITTPAATNATDTPAPQDTTAAPGNQTDTPAPITPEPTPTPPTPAPSTIVVSGVVTIEGNNAVFIIMLTADLEGLKAKLAFDLKTKLGVQHVEIVSVKEGSLIVEFTVATSDASAATGLQTSIENLKDDATWLNETEAMYNASATEEQRNSDGFALRVTSSTAEIKTTLPGGEDPDSNRKSNTGIIIAIVIIVIIVLLVVGIFCFKTMKKKPAEGEGAPGGKGAGNRSYASYAHESGDIEMHNAPPPAPGTI